MKEELKFPDINETDFFTKFKDLRIHFTLSRAKLEDILSIQKGFIYRFETNTLKLDALHNKRTYNKIKKYFDELIEIENMSNTPLSERLKNVVYEYKTIWNKEYYNPELVIKGK